MIAALLKAWLMLFVAFMLLILVWFYGDPTDHPVESVLAGAGIGLALRDLWDLLSD